MKRYLMNPPKRWSRVPALPLLMVITISGTFPMHLFVPVLPLAASDLHVAAGALQSAITAYLIGLSLGQVIMGPLSDMYGRRPILIAGLVIYILATIAAAFAPNLPALIAARVVQAMGGCAGLVLGRAITRDITDGDKAIQTFALLTSATTIGPAIAPLTGAYLAGIFGWRGMFLAVAVLVSILLAITVLTLAETHLERGAGSMDRYFRSWQRLCRNQRFLHFSVGGAFATTGFYAFVANAPFILGTAYGFSPHTVGLLCIPVIGSLTIGNLVARRLAGLAPPGRMVLYTSSWAVTCASIIWLMDRYGVHNAPVYLILVSMLTLCTGINSPFTVSVIVGSEPNSVGAASGLYGCIQMGMGALIVFCTGLLPFDPSTDTAVSLLVTTIISLIAYVTARSVKRAEPIQPVNSELVTEAED